MSRKDDARKQQFISAHPTNFMEKMVGSQTVDSLFS
jgi:hypothetical protein